MDRVGRDVRECSNDMWVSIEIRDSSVTDNSRDVVVVRKNEKDSVSI